jgi:hypothetical protein
VEIALTNHARFKLKVLEEHGYSFTEDEIKETVKHPAFTKYSTSDLAEYRPIKT